MPLSPYFRSSEYHIETDVYQGPLDLLLSLIEKAELDITALSLAQVTDPFLSILEEMEEDDPEEVSAFLVIAARLVQIKSAVLLPKSPIPSESLDEDTGEVLARQLIAYKQFKELANHLEAREARGLRSYLRLTVPDCGIEPPLDTSGLTPALLSAIAGKVFAIKKPARPLNSMMKKPRLTIHEKISLLLSRLKTKRRVRFHSLLRLRNKEESVVTFLAMLELMKQHIIAAEQEEIFGEIEIRTLRETQQDELIQTEFGE